MGCPCANPPGKGGKPVPRNPMTLKPISSNAPLSRQDIRLGRTRKEAAVVSDEVESDPPPNVDEEATAPRRPYRLVYRKRPMGGFLSDTMRKR